MDASITKISICNKALSHIKVGNLSSLAEQSEAAFKCNLFYDCARRSALRACDWRFARVQRPLTLLGDINTAIANPVSASPLNSKYWDIIDQFEFTYLYPSDCVRMVKVYNPYHAIHPEPYGDRHMAHGKEDFFEIMRSPVTNQMALGCNLERARCHYTVDMKDESQFDDMFQDALGWMLALELCIPLTADQSLMAATGALAEKFIEEAMRKNWGESTEVSPRESPYEQCRNNGGLERGNHEY